MTKEHTPTPWKVEEQDDFTVVVGHDGKEITSSYDRDHAVKCVNMHDELVAALKLLLSSAHDNQTGIQEAEDALKKAGAL